MAEPTTYTCYRCGREMDIWWTLEGVDGEGGNCTACGQDLCRECAVEWNEHGECKQCDERYRKETEEEK